MLRIVRPRREDRYVTCVPLLPLEAAAGYLDRVQSDPEGDGDWEWVEIDTHRRLRPGMFIARVVGKSMEPTIPDGSYCLFGGPVTGTRKGRMVLVQLRDTSDPETGGRYTVKRYDSDKVTLADGTWRHFRITLKPDNHDFQPIELTTEDEGTVAVIAEMLEVFH
jgi:phage repressor protein C with HTH and peptisase S24 domain